MSQNPTKKPSKNILVSNMNTINSNEIILVLNPNSQGGNTGKNWIEIYTKVKDFLPKITRLYLLKKRMMVY